tara:strand:+ start:809 stop:1033 length:225 start_codon:yes stop_codon:yes gene_type:complete
MSNMQYQLNAQSINKLAAIKSLINNSNDYAANQMKSAALRAMLNSSEPIDSMSDKQVQQFENNLISTFEYKNWI